MLIEGHGRFNRSTAMKIGKELEKYPNNGWFEEPVITEDKKHGYTGTATG